LLESCGVTRWCSLDLHPQPGKTPSCSMRARLRRLFSAVSDSIKRNPSKAAFGIGATVGPAGDGVAQLVEHRSEHRSEETGSEFRLNMLRCASMGVYNGTFAACAYVPFYAFLDSWLGAGSSIRVVASKTAMDQLLMMPLVELPLYFGWTGLCDGRSMDQIVSGMRSNYSDALVGTWAIWVPVLALNFAFIPLHLQVPVAYLADFVWASMVSWVSHRPAAAAPDEPLKEIGSRPS